MPGDIRRVTGAEAAPGASHEEGHLIRSTIPRYPAQNCGIGDLPFPCEALEFAKAGGASTGRVRWVEGGGLRATGDPPADDPACRYLPS